MASLFRALAPMPPGEVRKLTFWEAAGILGADVADEETSEGFTELPEAMNDDQVAAFLGQLGA